MTLKILRNEKINCETKFIDYNGKLSNTIKYYAGDTSFFLNDVIDVREVKTYIVCDVGL